MITLVEKIIRQTVSALHSRRERNSFAHPNKPTTPFGAQILSPRRCQQLDDRVEQREGVGRRG